MNNKYKPFEGKDGQRSILTKDIPLDDMVIDIVDNRVVGIDLYYSIPGEIGSSRKIATRIPIPIFNEHECLGDYCESPDCKEETHVALEPGLLQKLQDVEAESEFVEQEELFLKMNDSFKSKQEINNDPDLNSKRKPNIKALIALFGIQKTVNEPHFKSVPEAIEELTDALHKDFVNLHPAHPLANWHDPLKILTVEVASADATIGLCLTDLMERMLEIVKNDEVLTEHIREIYYRKYPVKVVIRDLRPEDIKQDGKVNRIQAMKYAIKRMLG